MMQAKRGKQMIEKTLSKLKRLWYGHVPEQKQASDHEQKQKELPVPIQQPERKPEEELPEYENLSEPEHDYESGRKRLRFVPPDLIPEHIVSVMRDPRTRSGRNYLIEEKTAVRLKVAEVRGPKVTVDITPEEVHYIGHTTRVWTHEEIVEVIDGLVNPRDKLAAWLIYTTGMRAEEVVNLEISDVNPTTNRIYIRKRKGKPFRYIHVPKSVPRAILAYTGRRTQGKVFEGYYPSRNWSSSALNHIFEIYAPRGMVARTLRWHFAMNMYRDVQNTSAILHYLGIDSRTPHAARKIECMVKIQDRMYAKLKSEADAGNQPA